MHTHTQCNSHVTWTGIAQIWIRHSGYTAPTFCPPRQKLTMVTNYLVEIIDIRQVNMYR